MLHQKKGVLKMEGKYKSVDARMMEFWLKLGENEKQEVLDWLEGTLAERKERSA